MPITILSAIAALAANKAVEPVQDEFTVVTDFELGAYSKYVWRGINVVDDYTNEGEDQPSFTHPRFDYAVRVAGPIVADIVHAVDLLWVRLSWLQLRRPLRSLRDVQLRHPGYADHPPCGTTRAALALRDNLRFRHTIEQSYLHAMGRARRDILIACAYFLPGRRLRKALVAATARGVRVRLLLQGKAEYLLQRYATRAMYDELLSHGIEIYEYMPSFLHAKVAVVDDYATVGSSNLDPFSLLLAREANVVVDDAGFAARRSKKCGCADIQPCSAGLSWIIGYTGS